MSDQVSGGVQIQFNAKDGTGTAVESLRSRIRKMRSEIQEAGHDANKMSEQIEKGAEHAAHHMLRHAGLGGLLLTGGAAGFAVTAATELFSKITEAYERRMEEIKKAFEAQMKLAEEGSKAAFGLTRLTHQEKVDAESHPEKGKIISELRKENPSLSHADAEEQAEYLLKHAPAEAGQVGFAGLLSRRGADFRHTAQYGEASQGRYEEMTEFGNKLSKNIKGEAFEGAMLKFAQDLTKMDKEKAERKDLHHITADDIWKAKQYFQNISEAGETPGHQGARLDAEQKENLIAQAQIDTPNITAEKHTRAEVERLVPGFLGSTYGAEYANGSAFTKDPGDYYKNIKRDSVRYQLDKAPGSYDGYEDRAMFGIMPEMMARALQKVLVPHLRVLGESAENINGAAEHLNGAADKTHPAADSKP